MGEEQEYQVDDPMLGDGKPNGGTQPCKIAGREVPPLCAKVRKKICL